MTFNQQQFKSIISSFPNYQEVQKLSLSVFEKIPSTNQKLWELIDRGVSLPLVAIATEQTAGRGQWGRQWQSHLGGLYLSVALSPHISASKASHLTLCSAWGIATALRHYQIPVLLKWPNDFILQGRKLGGIKSETRIQQAQITQVVIGVGLNWTNPVPEVGINLQSFLQAEPKSSITSLEMLAAIALDGLLSGYQYYLIKGIETLLPSYLELLHSRGRAVTVNGCPGVVVGITPQGELRVRLSSAGATTEMCLQPGTISLGYTETIMSQ